MKNAKTGLGLLLVLAGYCQAEKINAPQPREARTVTVPEGTMPPVNVAKGQTTVFSLPEGELLYHVIGGGNNWVIGGRDPSTEKAPAAPSRWVDVVPQATGITTVLHLISNTQRKFSFQLIEVSGKGEPYDSEIEIDTSGTGRKPTPLAEVKWLPAEQEQVFISRAEKAEAREKEAASKEKVRVEELMEKFRAQYPYTLHHEFSYDGHKAQALGVRAAWRDDKFTYVEGKFRDLPALYEVKEGGPSLVDTSYRDGLYIVPKLLDQFYLAVGKQKKNKVDFSWGKR